MDDLEFFKDYAQYLDESNSINSKSSIVFLFHNSELMLKHPYSFLDSERIRYFSILMAIYRKFYNVPDEEFEYASSYCYYPLVACLELFSLDDLRDLKNQCLIDAERQLNKIKSIK